MESGEINPGHSAEAKWEDKTISDEVQDVQCIVKTHKLNP